MKLATNRFTVSFIISELKFWNQNKKKQFIGTFLLRGRVLVGSIAVQLMGQERTRREK